MILFLLTLNLSILSKFQWNCYMLNLRSESTFVMHENKELLCDSTSWFRARREEVIDVAVNNRRRHSERCCRNVRRKIRPPIKRRRRRQLRVVIRRSWGHRWFRNCPDCSLMRLVTQCKAPVNYLVYYFSYIFVTLSTKKIINISILMLESLRAQLKQSCRYKWLRF